MKVKDILSYPSKWAQCAAARDRFGEPCAPSSPQAASYCILGALMRVYEEDEWEASVEKVMRAISARGWRCKSLLDVAAWNNHLGRTFSEVRKVLEKADV